MKKSIYRLSFYNFILLPPPGDSNPRPLDYEATALPTELLCLGTSQGVKTYLFKVFTSLRNLEKFLQVLFQHQLQASQANRGLLSEMPMTISKAGKPSKPRIAKRDANRNLYFLHRLQVVSVPLLTGAVIGEK